MCAGIMCSKSFLKPPKIEISQDLQGLGVDLKEKGLKGSGWPWKDELDVEKGLKYSLSCSCSSMDGLGLLELNSFGLNYSGLGLMGSSGLSFPWPSGGLGAARGKKKTSSKTSKKT